MSLLREIRPHLVSMVLIWSGGGYFSFLGLKTDNVNLITASIGWILITCMGHNGYCEQVIDNNKKSNSPWLAILYGLFYIPYLIYTQLFFCRLKRR